MAEGSKSMTDFDQQPAAETDYRTDRPLRFWQRAGSGQSPIVPEGSIASTALVFVIAIMTFLACLTLGAVLVVRQSAEGWQSQIAREATIQIKPAEGLDMEAALVSAQKVASGFTGVRNATIVDKDATARLLEPWLGEGLDFETLPVPRLIIITIDPASPPDFETMKMAVSETVPQAVVEDHRTWVDRLVSMSRTTVLIGVGILALVLIATALAVVFATRGAMAGNGQIIEVLHFVGAEQGYIARQFQRRFFVTGIKGATAGGLAAVLVFLGIKWWSSSNIATPEGDQANALFGAFSLGWTGYAAILVTVILVAALTAETTRFTVIRHLNGLDRARPD